jgi:hypothetical protein
MAFDFPVMVEVARPDGSQELVRVGTARRDGAYFVLDLGSLRIGTSPPPVGADRLPGAATALEELEYIAARARKTLADASKSRWHAQERALLEQVEVELSRWKAGQGEG